MLGVGDLIRGGAAHLPHTFQDVVHAVDVSLAEQSAIGVHGRLAADLDVAVLDEVARFAPTAEAERLELQEHDGREVLVDHRDIDVVGREA